eukprot:scaffold9277_cov130-Cylindrotheca_fusiformis.AAC.1
MGTLTFVSTAALIQLGETPTEPPSNFSSFSSSINFCEEDFSDSYYVAEPANAISSLTTFCPLALLGLLGPPRFTQQQQEYDSSSSSTMNKININRFSLAYISLMVIGVGSFWLHSALTAKAQGGDELPMLWYAGVVAFIDMECILEIRRQKQQQQQKKKNGEQTTKMHPPRKWLVYACTLSSVAATWTYVFNRDHWIVFYFMFSVYCVMILFGHTLISFSDLTVYHGKNVDSFRGNILLPLMSCSLWFYILASTIWVSEMVFCHDATTTQRWGTVIAPWIWNRAVHPAWHCTSGLGAFLILQIGIAVRGFQLGWGEPRIKWFGAPYVAFGKKKEEMLTKED